MTAKEILMFVSEKGLTSQQYSIVHYEKSIYRKDGETIYKSDLDFVRSYISENAIILGGYFIDDTDYWVVGNLDDAPQNVPADIVLEKKDDQLILCYAIR